MMENKASVDLFIEKIIALHKDFRVDKVFNVAIANFKRIESSCMHSMPATRFM